MDQLLLFLLAVYRSVLHLQEIFIPGVIQEIYAVILFTVVKGKLEIKIIKCILKKLKILFTSSPLTESHVS
jgi:hypothetical protein